MASAAGAPEGLIPVTTVAVGTTSGIQTFTLVVIRNRTEWNALWQKHTAGARGTAAAVPTIDFTQQMVIGLFAGKVEPETRATIFKVVRGEQQLRVIYRIANLQPGPTPSDLPTSAPFHIVRLAWSPLPVIFVPAAEKDIY